MTYLASDLLQPEGWIISSNHHLQRAYVIDQRECVLTLTFFQLFTLGRTSSKKTRQNFFKADLGAVDIPNILVAATS